MQSFKHFMELDEHIINLLPHDTERRERHATELYNLVHSSYKSIGGIKESGFGSPHDIKTNIPMVKANQKNGKINSALFYKDTGGRKRVAIASDGTPEGKAALGKMMKDDLKQSRAYGESSGASLKFLHKHLPAEDIKSFAIHPDKIKESMPHDEFRDVPHDDPEVIAHPHLASHFYQRKIGGEFKTKVALGKMGNVITS